MAIAAAAHAKNKLRRRHGCSPNQLVFGKDPRLPEDLLAGGDEEQFLELMSADRRCQREVAIRTATRVAFFRLQVDTRLRRGLLQHAGVKKGPYAVGKITRLLRSVIDTVLMLDANCKR